MYDKVIGLVLFLAATTFPPAAHEPTAPHQDVQSIAAEQVQDPDPGGGEGPNN